MKSSPRGRSIWIVDHFEELISGVALLCLVFSVSWGVVTRYITETPAAWTGDAAAISFAWLVFPGSAAAFKYRMHMSVDILWRLIPNPLRRIVTMLTDMLVLAFLGYSCWLGLQFCISSLGDPMPILRWPRTVLYASVASPERRHVGLHTGFVDEDQPCWLAAHEGLTPALPLTPRRFDVRAFLLRCQQCFFYR